jgi:hypothetical protein
MIATKELISQTMKYPELTAFDTSNTVHRSVENRLSALPAAESQWIQSMSSVFGSSPPSSAYWSSLDLCIDYIAPFIGGGAHRCFLPTGEAVELHDVDRSYESGCIEFKTSDNRTLIAKPSALRFERIRGAPGESFCLLELGRLSPCSLLTEARTFETLIELTPLRYVDAEGFVDVYDGADNWDMTVDRSATVRRVTRWLGGKILITPKASSWGDAGTTCDDRHNRLAAASIKRMIDDTLQSRSTAIANASVLPVAIKF